ISCDSKTAKTKNSGVSACRVVNPRRAIHCKTPRLDLEEVSKRRCLGVKNRSAGHGQILQNEPGDSHCFALQISTFLSWVYRMKPAMRRLSETGRNLLP